MQNPFAILRDNFEPLINAERLLLLTLGATAVVSTSLPLLWPHLPKEVKLTSNVWGLFSGLCFAGECHRRRIKEKTYSSIEDANHAIVKEHLKGTFTFEKATQEIVAKRQLAAYVNSLPVEERGRWAQQYGLQGLVEIPQIQQAVIDQPRQAPQLKPVFNGVQSSIEDISEDLSAPVDYTWMDAKFINASKAVFGPKGSGKSVVLAYEAIAFLTHFPEGELRIGDRHFDEDESLWLPGIPGDILLKDFVAKKPDQILNMFRRAGQLLRHRVDAGIKASHPDCKPFKLICDEFESFLLQLSDDEKKEVMSIIAQSQDEGRKYQVNITLGMHSIKKERVGVDSSVLFQMDVLCLGSALADPNTRYPADIDAKGLLVKQMELQRVLKKSQGFACVVRKLGEMARVEVIPFLDLTKFSFEYEEVQPEKEDTVNWYRIMADWIRQLGRNPTDDELKMAWEKVSNQQLTDKGVKLLRENLDLRDKRV